MGSRSEGRQLSTALRQRGDAESLELLCGKGADVGWKPTGSPSALWAAVARADGDVVRVLLRFGADAKDVVPGGAETIEEYVKRTGDKGVRDAFEKRESKIENQGGEKGVGTKSG